METSIDQIFRWVIQKRQFIITIFKIWYAAILILIFLGAYSFINYIDSFSFYYDFAQTFGQIGLVFYILTVIPGISRRFGIKYKLLSILMIFRRYTGISMFLSILYHFLMLRGIEMIQKMTINLASFELMGFIALCLTFFLFVTSNDFSVTHLKKIWNYIHKLTYIVIWFIVFHLLLQRVSVWSILITSTAILQIFSYFYSRLIKRII